MGKRLVGLAVACLLGGGCPGGVRRFGGLVDVGRGHRDGRPRCERQRLRRQLRRHRPVGLRDAQRRHRLERQVLHQLRRSGQAADRRAGDHRLLDQAGRLSPGQQEEPSSRTDASYVFKINVNTLRFTTPGVRDHTRRQYDRWRPRPGSTWPSPSSRGRPGRVAFYLNGTQTSQLDASTLPGGTGPFRIGNDQWNEWFTGQIDEVPVYTHVLTELEVRAVMMNQTYPFAVLTAPANRSAIAAGQVVLEWRKGPLGRLAPRVLQCGRPGGGGRRRGRTDRHTPPTVASRSGPRSSPYPDGLTPGKTYYWRVDEVNPDNPDSPWKGQIWSFWVQPATAWNPSPADGVKYINLQQDLTWSKGQGVLFHTVFLGESLETVGAATTGGFMTTDIKYDPGVLKADTTYYWRVDEFTMTATTQKGPVWSFRTMPEIAVTDPNLLARWTLDEGAGNNVVRLVGPRSSRHARRQPAMGGRLFRRRPGVQRLDRLRELWHAGRSVPAEKLLVLCLVQGRQESLRQQRGSVPAVHRLAKRPGPGHRGPGRCQRRPVAALL